MDGIKCYDVSGNLLKHLYQLDLDQVVKLVGVDMDLKLEIQCCSADSAEALVVKHRTDELNVVVPIPNILLQRPVPIMIYICQRHDDGMVQTIGVVRIGVTKKAKPSDYIYTESEVLYYRVLDAKMEEIRSSIVNLEEQIPDVLPNPHPLVINGQSYDGSSTLRIDISSNIKQIVDDYMFENPIVAEETDPTVPEWAKQPTKPSYTAAEVGALPADTIIPEMPNVPVFMEGAVAGQVLTVRSVDSDGKPTELEAVDIEMKGEKGDKGESGVYMLSEGESLENVPSDASVIIDPYGTPDYTIGDIIAEALEVINNDTY